VRRSREVRLRGRKRRFTVVLAEDGGPGFGVGGEVLGQDEGTFERGKGRAVDFVFGTFEHAADAWDAEVKAIKVKD